MRIAVYTSIMGAYNELIPQPRYPGVDYICFTDQPFESDVWDVRKVQPIGDDMTRNNRQYKILPHKFLPDYDVSIYIDGNYIVTKDVKELIEKELGDHSMLVFDHNQCSDARNCVYDEHLAILKLGEERGTYKADPAKMKKQMDRYRSEGYPEQNGLIFAACLIRRHHDPLVIQQMESWWAEINKECKRDQMAFNYTAWKNNFRFKVLDGDLRNHEYFFLLAKHGQDFKKKYWKYRFKKFFGLRPKR